MTDTKTIMARMGLGQLNAMQEETLDKILGTDGDVVVVAPTGSGKTLAYMLPLVQLLDTDADRLQALVVVPGRELALQSAGVMDSMKAGVRSVCCYGGRPAMDEHRTLRQVRPHVVFGTPGRLNDHLDKENILPYGIRYVVIDEFDKCLEMGFHTEMAQLLDRLVGVRRRILLSATDAEQIPDFVSMGKTVKIDYATGLPFGHIDMYCARSREADKLEALDGLLRLLGEGSCMVFLNHRDSVERVSAYLRERSYGVSAFHGGMGQDEREASLYRFANGSASVLVSTDLASRGLDIPHVDTIVHYHLPPTRESFVHRIGRTARWDAAGRSVFLLGPTESLPEFVSEAHTEWPLPEQLPPVPQPRMATLYIGKGKRDKVSKGDVVGFLCKICRLKSQDIGRIDVKERFVYVAVARTKASSALALAQGEKIKGLKTVFEMVK